MARTLSNVIGIDDGPFTRGRPEPVFVAAPVFSRTRMDGLLTCTVTQDGDDATDNLAEMIVASKFRDHAHLIMMGGVTLGGFNVVDIQMLHDRTELPVLVVVRKEPDFQAISNALSKVPNTEVKTSRLNNCGPLHKTGAIWVQCCGLTLEEAYLALEATTLHGNFPEPLRAAHIIAGGVVAKTSKGGA